MRTFPFSLRVTVALTGAVMLIVIAVWVIASSGGDETVRSTTDAPRASSTEDGPEPKRVPAADLEAGKIEGATPQTRDVVPVVEDLVAEAAAAASSVVEGKPSANEKQINALSVGAMRGELRSLVEEFGVNGWQQQGTPTIESVKVGALTDRGRQVVVEACLDSSKVKVIDEAGNDVLENDENPRSTNIFTLTRKDAEAPWSVASRGFPDEADC